MQVDPGIDARVRRVKALAHDDCKLKEIIEAASIAQSIVHDTAGPGHPLMHTLREAVRVGDWTHLLGACRAMLALYEDGALPGPRLRIAHEIDGAVLDIAQAQAQIAERTDDPANKQLGLSIAAFLAGAALEDALRRISDEHAVGYDAQRATIAKLQAALYQPSTHAEFITQSENKQITAWGDTRNKADHGKFSEITQTEVVTMVIGVRAFVDKYLP